VHIAKLTATAAAWFPLVSDAQASEWDCEILLCASSSNPSWRGVSSCHPDARTDLRNEELGIHMADMP
jgi:hypothetical protein